MTARKKKENMEPSALLKENLIDCLFLYRIILAAGEKEELRNTQRDPISFYLYIPFSVFRCLHVWALSEKQEREMPILEVIIPDLTGPPPKAFLLSKR